MSASAVPFSPPPVIVPSGEEEPNPEYITAITASIHQELLASGSLNAAAHLAAENPLLNEISQSEDVQEGTMIEFRIHPENPMLRETENSLSSRPSSGASVEETEPFPAFDADGPDFQPPSLLHQAQEAVYEHRLGQIANELLDISTSYPPSPPRGLQMEDYQHHMQERPDLAQCAELVHYNHFCTKHEFDKLALRDGMVEMLNAESDLPQQCRETFLGLLDTVMGMEGIFFSRSDHRSDPLRHITQNELKDVREMAGAMVICLVRIGHNVGMELRNARIARSLVRQVAARSDLSAMEQFRQMAEAIMKNTVKVRRSEEILFESFLEFYEGYFYDQFHFMYNNWLVEHLPDVDRCLRECSYLLATAFRVMDQFIIDYRRIANIVTRLKRQYIHPLLEAISMHPSHTHEIPNPAVYHVFAMEIEQQRGPQGFSPNDFAHDLEPVSPQASINTQTIGTRTDVSVYGSSTRSTSPITIPPRTYDPSRPPRDADFGLENEIPTYPPHFASAQDSGYGDSSGYSSDYESTEPMSDGEFDRCLAIIRQTEAEAGSLTQAERSQTLDFSHNDIQNTTTTMNTNTNAVASCHQRSDTIDSNVENPHALFLDSELAESTEENVPLQTPYSYSNHSLTEEAIDDEEDDDQTLTGHPNGTTTQDEPEDDDSWVVAPNPWAHYVDSPRTFISRPSPTHSLVATPHADASSDNGNHTFRVFVERIQSLAHMRQYERIHPYTDTETLTRVYYDSLPEFAQHDVSEPPYVATREFLPADYGRVIAERGRGRGNGRTHGAGRGRLQTRVDRLINNSPLLPLMPPYSGRGQNQGQRQQVQRQRQRQARAWARAHGDGLRVEKRRRDDRRH
ncbi:hypothetical protein BDV18DRAFT_163224 [Aspergillus unguis]